MCWKSICQWTRLESISLGCACSNFRSGQRQSWFLGCSHHEESASTLLHKHGSHSLFGEFEPPELSLSALKVSNCVKWWIRKLLGACHVEACSFLPCVLRLLLLQKTIASRLLLNLERIRVFGNDFGRLPRPIRVYGWMLKAACVTRWILRNGLVTKMIELQSGHHTPSILQRSYTHNDAVSEDRY